MNTVITFNVLLRTCEFKYFEFTSQMGFIKVSGGMSFFSLGW